MFETNLEGESSLSKNLVASSCVAKIAAKLLERQPGNWNLPQRCYSQETHALTSGSEWMMFVTDKNKKDKGS